MGSKRDGYFESKKGNIKRCQFVERRGQVRTTMVYVLVVALSQSRITEFLF